AAPMPGEAAVPASLDASLFEASSPLPAFLAAPARLSAALPAAGSRVLAGLGGAGAGAGLLFLAAAVVDLSASPGLAFTRPAPPTFAGLIMDDYLHKSALPNCLACPSDYRQEPTAADCLANQPQDGLHFYTTALQKG